MPSVGQAVGTMRLLLLPILLAAVVTGARGSPPTNSTAGAPDWGGPDGEPPVWPSSDGTPPNNWGLAADTEGDGGELSVLKRMVGAGGSPYAGEDCPMVDEGLDVVVPDTLVGPYQPTPRSTWANGHHPDDLGYAFEQALSLEVDSIVVSAVNSSSPPSPSWRHCFRVDVEQFFTSIRDDEGLADLRSYGFEQAQLNGDTEQVAAWDRLNRHRIIDYTQSPQRYRVVGWVDAWTAAHSYAAGVALRWIGRRTHEAWVDGSVLPNICGQNGRFGPRGRG